MEYKFCSSQEDVEKFLLALKEILLNPNFNINKDLDILLKKKTEDPLDPYTTQNTLNKLDYDNEERKVFCISFHFARFKNEKFPYKGGNIYE